MRLEDAELSRALVAPMVAVFVLFGSTGLAMLVLPLHVHHALGFDSLVFHGFGLQVVRRAAPQYRAFAMGGYTACLDLALGLGCPAFGLVAEMAGLSAVFACAALLVLPAAGLALHFMFRNPAAASPA